MKKIILFLTMQIVFYFQNIQSSELQENSTPQDSYSRSKRLYQAIDATTIFDNKDAHAYTLLVQLRHYTFALQEKKNSTNQRHTRDLYNKAKEKAEQVRSAKNPQILEALQEALQYAKETIQ